MTSPRKLFATTIALGIIGTILVAMLAVDGIRWRISVLALVASGRIPALGLGETVRMLRPGGGYYLKPLLDRRSPYLVIENPYTTRDDSVAGAELFRSRCNLCHSDARQAPAPRLTDGRFVHGGSDWAVYRSITRGIPETAMRAQDVTEREAWQLIAYIRGVARRPGTHGDQTDSHALAEPLAGLRAIEAERLLQARQTPGDWLTYSGAYDGWRYSPLKQVSSANVRQLRVQWMLQLPGSEPVESTPLVVDGVMFVSAPPNTVFALDASNGTVLWSYRRQLPSGLRTCCGLVNRGVAVAGTRVFLATLDAHLVALDARSGDVAWDVKLADYDAGYSATGAPLVVANKVMVGIAGGEYGIRGFLDAYDEASGQRLWRFNTVPGPGEKGHESWGGESWKTGGAPTWLTGAYDPELRLLYWGVGNPGPNYDGGTRPGDNLYTNSVVALDVTSGMLRWHFQFTPHDEHDWDSVQIPVLVDGNWRGSRRPLMLWANRNGFYYVLDRTTGEFLLARPFVTQSWADRIDSSGRPIVRPGSSPSAAGTALYPSVVGGTNWWSPSYSPQTGYLYVPVVEEGGTFFRQAVNFRRGEPFIGSTHQGIPEEHGFTAVRAIRAETGEVAWDHRFAGTPSRHLINGVLATGGGLVFGSDGSSVVALGAVSGLELWRFQTGGQVWAAPIAYEVGGTEVVAVAAGNSIITFGLK